MTQFSVIPQSPSGFPDNSIRIIFLPHTFLIPKIFHLLELSYLKNPCGIQGTKIFGLFGLAGTVD